jgi:hypothetical protein
MNADIRAFQTAQKSVVQQELERRFQQLEAELLEVECRKTASLVREARRALRWEFPAALPSSTISADELCPRCGSARWHFPVDGGAACGVCGYAIPERKVNDG